MKLSLTSSTNTYSIEMPDGLDIHAMMDYVKSLMMSAGYHPDSVEAGFRGIVDDYDNETEANRRQNGS